MIKDLLEIFIDGRGTHHKSMFINWRTNSQRKNQKKNRYKIRLILKTDLEIT
jgi:hypothetical protein